MKDPDEEDLEPVPAGWKDPDFPHEFLATDWSQFVLVLLLDPPHSKVFFGFRL